MANMARKIGVRSVSVEMQERFAALSGDRNPMHMDKVAARKTPPGAPVVHGVHTLLWALESVVSVGKSASPREVRARFLRWVYLDEEATVLIEDDADEEPQHVKVEVNGVTVCTASLSYGELLAADTLPEDMAATGPRLAASLDLGMMEMEGRSGRVGMADLDETARMFPALSAMLGEAAVAECAACSYVVGMEAPGLHSMFSKMEVSFRSPASDARNAALHYEVVRVDERFRKVRIQVEGTAISGTLEAFVRMPPVKQISMAEAKSIVQAGEFAEVRACVIGGSRGLGEVTAKLLAAGGANVVITYVTGKADAEAVAEEIREHGSEAHVLEYDVSQDAPTQVRALPWVPTHLFYFATPTIARAKAGVFSSALYAEFTRYYLGGFYDLCVALLAVRAAAVVDGKKLKVFYPSTVFVESRPQGMTEYAMVKAAGEALCTDMNLGLAGIEVLAPRLPKLPTDQTAGVLPEREGNAVAALLPLLRQIAGNQ